MSKVPRTPVTKAQLSFDTHYSTYTTSAAGQVKGQMELPYKGGLTVEQVREIIEEARESIIQTICDAVERMIEDANNR